MIQKTFYIKTLIDGRQYPILNTYPQKYEMLYELGMNQYSKSEGVRDAIQNLNKVISGELVSFELSTGDWCVVDVKRDTSVITNNFDEFEPVEIITSEIIKLMNEWLQFLLTYENGQIPGIIHPDKRDLV